MAVVFDRKFRGDPVEAPEVRPDGAVPFFVDMSGIGDTVVALGFVEGYRAMGIPSWIVSERGDYKSLLRVFGEHPRPLGEDSVGAVRTGGRAHYHMGYLRRGYKTHSYAEWMQDNLRERPQWKQATPLVDPEVRAWAAQYREYGEWEGSWGKCSGKPVLLFPEAHFGTRVWPKNFFVDLAHGLRQRGVRSIAVLPHEGGAGVFPSFMAGLSLEQVGALMGEAGAVVGNDSGPAHLAGMLGVPTLAICGPTQNMFSQYTSVTQVHVDPGVLGCTGCWFNADKGYRAACDSGCRALAAVTPEEIYYELAGIFQHPGLLSRGLGDQPGPTHRPLEGLPGAVGSPVQSFSLPVLRGRWVGTLRERGDP